MAAQQQLLALMSSASGHNNNNSPEPLYDLSLMAVVNGLDCKVPTLERISKLPELPRNLLIDVYELVSFCYLKENKVKTHAERGCKK